MAKWTLNDLFKKENEQMVEQQSTQNAYVDNRLHIQDDWLYDRLTQNQKREVESVIAPEATRCCEYAFSGAVQMKEIHMPNVEQIDKSAFMNCLSLEKATAAPGANIEWGAFMGTNLEKMTNSVGDVGKYAFAQTQLESIEFHRSATSIGQEAFRDCSNLSEVKLNDGLKEIGAEAFRDCKNLKEIYIPASVQSVGPHAFMNCDNIEINVANHYLATQLSKEYPNATVSWQPAAYEKYPIEPEQKAPVALDDKLRNLSDYLNSPDIKESVHLHKDVDGVTKVSYIPESLTKINYDLPYPIEPQAIRESNIQEFNYTYYHNPHREQIFDATDGCNIQRSLCTPEEFKEKVEEANKIKAMEKDMDKANEVEKEKPKDMEIDFG